jgi:hypothetical protein
MLTCPCDGCATGGSVSFAGFLDLAGLFGAGLFGAGAARFGGGSFGPGASGLFRLLIRAGSVNFVAVARFPRAMLAFQIARIESVNHCDCRSNLQGESSIRSRDYQIRRVAGEGAGRH